MTVIHNNLNPPQKASFADDANAGSSQILIGVQVLLVEDEPDIAELLSFILQGFGAEVIEVHSAEAAWNLLTQSQPDILICNIRLPDHDGSWLVKQVRQREVEHEERLPAIAVTSYTREVGQAYALSAGFQQFMQKPLDPYQLVAEVVALTEPASHVSNGSSEPY